jgi:hypothetical protein
MLLTRGLGLRRPPGFFPENFIEDNGAIKKTANFCGFFDKYFISFIIFPLLILFQSLLLLYLFR